MIVVKSTEFIKGAVHPKDYPTDGLAHIAVVGRSNAGKSSLLNFLLNRRNLVRTSRVPGKTREINFFLVNKSFYLVDIPGFGYAKAGQVTRAHMEKAISDYFNRCASIAGVLYLLDIRLSDSPIDAQAISWIVDLGHPILAIATKSDKLNKQKCRESLDALAKNYNLSIPPIPTSILKKSGREEVLEQLELLL